jgi:EVE domain
MAHYLFNFSKADPAKGPARCEQAVGLLRVKMWGVRADESHRDALARGDLVLVYVGAPERGFVGRAELASAARDWTPSEARLYPGDSLSGVLFSQVEEWSPPVPVKTVLSRLDAAENAKGDFPAGVVRITPHEYQTVLAVSAGRLPPSLG